LNMESENNFLQVGSDGGGKNGDGDHDPSGLVEAAEGESVAHVPGEVPHPIECVEIEGKSNEELDREDEGVSVGHFGQQTQVVGICSGQVQHSNSEGGKEDGESHSSATVGDGEH